MALFEVPTSFLSLALHFFLKTFIFLIRYMLFGCILLVDMQIITCYVQASAITPDSIHLHWSTRGQHAGPRTTTGQRRTLLDT